LRKSSSPVILMSFQFPIWREMVCNRPCTILFLVFCALVGAVFKVSRPFVSEGWVDLMLTGAAVYCCGSQARFWVADPAGFAKGAFCRVCG
jgi:hypothetical protein